MFLADCVLRLPINTGQFVMEGFLRLRIKPWKRVAFTRTIAMVPTLMVAVFASERTLNSLNEWLNILQSFQLPFALIPLLHFAAIPGLMGIFRLRGAAHVSGNRACLVFVVCHFRSARKRRLSVVPLMGHLFLSVCSRTERETGVAKR